MLPRTGTSARHARTLHHFGAALVIAVMASMVAASRAAAQFFEPVGGLQGGWVSCLAREPGSGHLYAGVMFQWGYNNVGGDLFKSVDHGASWVRLQGAFGALPEQNTSVRAIAVSPVGTIYVAMYGAGVRRSQNAGASFSAVNTGLPAGLKARSLVFAPDGALLTAVEGQGVWQLPPGASTWTALNAGLPTLVVRSLGVSGSWTLAATLSGVFRRTGSGAWTAPSVGVGAIGVNAIVTLPSGVYACTDSGLWRSTDDGANWSAVSGPFDGKVVSTVGEAGSALLVGSQLGLHRSVNGGAWLPAGGGATIVPRAFLAEGATLLMGTIESGILSSTDEGASWTAQNAGLEAHTVLRLTATASGALLAGTPRTGIFRWSQGAWESPDLVGRDIFALATSPWGELFAGNYNITDGVSDGHAYASSDDGQNWSLIDLGAQPAMVSGFAFEAATQGVLCSVAWNSGSVRRRSADQQSWSAIGPSDNIPAYCIGRSAVGDLYIGSEGAGVRRLPAGQSTWINLGFSTSQQFALAFNSSGDVFFGNDGQLRGVYRSTDGGQSFQPLNGYPSLYGHALAIAPDGTIFAASRDMGVWRSQDNGDSWQDVSAGLASTSVLSLVIAPDGHLYAGSAGHGLYRSVVPVVSVCTADLDQSGTVNGADLGMLLASWGPVAPGAAADINHDGAVDGQDLGVLLGMWGACGQ